MGQAALKLKPAKRADYELLPIGKIAFRCDIDRATCKKRLDQAGYEPERDQSNDKLKLYRFDDEMKSVLTEMFDKITEVKIRQFTADARMRELKLAQAQGQLVPMDEVTDTVQRLFGAMHKEIAVRMSKNLGPRLAKAKTASAAAGIIKNYVDRTFKTLRDDFQKLLK